MELLEVVAGVSVLLGALLQSAVGFGFSLVCAPLVFAAFGPLEAVGLLTLLGITVNTFTLLGERRRPQPLIRDVVAPVLAWAVPGTVVGVFVLRALDAAVLQVVLTVAVFASLAVRRERRLNGARHRLSSWARPAGFAAGVLTTTTSTAGPPMVLLLLGRGLDPVRVRDTLTTTFASLSVLAIVVFAATGTDGAVPDATAIAAFVPLAAAGQVLGRPLFARLAGGHYERALTVTLLLSATVGLISALT